MTSVREARTPVVRNDVETVVLAIEMTAPTSRRDRVSPDGLKEHLIGELDGTTVWPPSDGDAPEPEQPYTVAQVTVPDFYGNQAMVGAEEPVRGTAVLAGGVVWVRARGGYWVPKSPAVAKLYEGKKITWQDLGGADFDVVNPIYIIQYTG